MKKLVLILIVAFIGSVTMSYAGQPDPKETNATKLHHAVNAKIKYPVIASENKIEGQVWVTIKVDPEGQVSVEEANSLSEELKSGVVKQLNKMKLSKDLHDSENTYLMKFSFELE